LPVAFVLGWVFVRRGSIWAPIGLHATFNAVLLIIANLAPTDAVG
jgi:membrane protease YdiL (CAAX protease family)